jgi:hypothetical protein
MPKIRTGVNRRTSRLAATVAVAVLFASPAYAAKGVLGNGGRGYIDNT